MSHKDCICFHCAALTKTHTPDCACNSGPLYVKETCSACPKRSFCDVPKNPHLYTAETTDSAGATDNSAMVEICSKNICEYCMHGNTKPIRCIFLENCGGFNWFKHFIGRKLHQ